MIKELIDILYDSLNNNLTEWNIFYDEINNVPIKYGITNEFFGCRIFLNLSFRYNPILLTDDKLYITMFKCGSIFKSFVILGLSSVQSYDVNGYVSEDYDFDNTISNEYRLKFIDIRNIVYDTVLKSNESSGINYFCGNYITSSSILKEIIFKYNRDDKLKNLLNDT